MWLSDIIEEQLLIRLLPWVTGVRHVGFIYWSKDKKKHRNVCKSFENKNKSITSLKQIFYVHHIQTAFSEILSDSYKKPTYRHASDVWWAYICLILFPLVFSLKHPLLTLHGKHKHSLIGDRFGALTKCVFTNFLLHTGVYRGVGVDLYR